MARFVIKDAKVLINGVDLSRRVAEVVVNTDVDDVDISTMGTGVHEHLGGLGNDNFVIKFLQDFASAMVDQTLWPLKSTSTSTIEFTVQVSSTSSALSSSNPGFKSTRCILLTYQPIQGAVGSRSEVDVTFPSNEAITRVYT